MPSVQPGHRAGQRLKYLVFLPVVGALIIVWGLAIVFKLQERTTDLAAARNQLATTVSALADFNEMAERSPGSTPDERTAQRTASIWRALLRYPTAAIWVVSDGKLIDGQPPTADNGPYLFVEEARAQFTVHAALPEADALTSWRSESITGSGILAVASLAFLGLTLFLSRTLRQRTMAEQEASLAQERTAQLTAFQTQLQQTVAARTQDLRTANSQLQEELHERKVAEDALRQHDAMLNAVTKSASELLGTHAYEDAVAVVLELIGQTIAVGRVQLIAIATGQDGHLHGQIAQEWCAPGATLTINNPEFQELDYSTFLPNAVAPALSGRPYTYGLADLRADLREKYRAIGMRSCLQIPVQVEGKLWGALLFIDSSEAFRHWSWAETDGLETLAGLVGVAIVRARYVKELADANMIVQNSPTILYRLRGEPSLPLTYISPNVQKFGHNATELMAAANWAALLVDPSDQAKFGDAMTKALQNSAIGGSTEFRLRTGDGTLRWVENRYTPVRDKFGRLKEIEGIIIDVTERKLAEDKIAQLARTDGLTGLANRTTFVDRLRQSFAAARRGTSPFAVLYLDIDHFKDVNDTLGHPVGDLLLREISDRIRANTRENDVVARLGGDEFAILQMDLIDPARAGELAGKLLSALAAPYTLKGNHVQITVSIGIAPYTAQAIGPDIVLTQADLALYRAKERGRNQYRFHSNDLDDQVRARVTLTAELREALKHDQLVLYFQPQVEVRSGIIVGVEALVRWRHPTRGVLEPAEFFPVVEQTGTVMALGHWVFDHAFRQMRQWRDEGIAPALMTVNLSLLQLKNTRELVEDVINTLSKHGLDATNIEFDVTEATLAQLKWTGNDVLGQLHRLGAQIAIDDFGTEYSSFDYLQSYNVSHLKIARTLIAKAITDPERAEMIRVMIALARELGIGIMAEGVETSEQRELLISTGTPTKAQGFYFSEPVNAALAAALLRKRIIVPVASLPTDVARMHRPIGAKRKKEPHP